MSGVVKLPAGFALTADKLMISSIGNPVAVSADGTFSVPEFAGGGPATVVVTDENGNLVLLGHVDTDNPAFDEVDVTSTAEELLFLSTLSFMLPLSQWTEAYALLSAAPETAILAAVISGRMAADPTAVGDVDGQITAALSAATQSLLAAQSGGIVDGGTDGGTTDAALESITFDAASDEAADAGSELPFSDAATDVVGAEVAPVDAGAPDASSLSRTISALSAAPGLVSVSVLSANPFGLSVAASLDDQGVYIENTKRIHRHYFVYRTGYVPSTGNSTDTATALPTWVPVTDGYLQAVTGVTGTVSGLADYSVGKKVAWAPKDTPTIPLPLDPPDAKANTFKVFVVGAGAAGPVDPGGNQLPPPDLTALQPNLVPTITDSARTMAYMELVREVVWPVLTKWVPGGPLVGIGDSQWAKFANQFVKEAYSLGFNIAPYVEGNKYDNVAVEFVKALASNKKLKDGIYNTVDSFLNTNVAVSWASVFKTVAGAINPADYALLAQDLGWIGYEAANSNMYNEWDVKTVPLVVKISPSSASVTPGAKQTFQVNVGGGIVPTGAASFGYDFTAGKGTLDSVAGTAPPCLATMTTPCVEPGGHELISSDGTVVYTAPMDAKPGDTDKLTVTVTYYPGGTAINQTFAPVSAQVIVTSGTLTVTLGAALEQGYYSLGNYGTVAHRYSFPASPDYYKNDVVGGQSVAMPTGATLYGRSPDSCYPMPIPCDQNTSPVTPMIFAGGNFSGSDVAQPVGSGALQGLVIALGWTGTAPGTYPCEVSLDGTLLPSTAGVLLHNSPATEGCACIVPGSCSVTLTSFGSNVGDAVTGTFSGEVWQWDDCKQHDPASCLQMTSMDYGMGDPISGYPLSGSFNLPRAN